MDTTNNTVPDNSKPSSIPFLRGSNISGQESGGSIWAFPRTEMVDYLYGKGMRVFRLIFGHERMCPKPGASLAEPYAALYETAVNYILAKSDTWVIIEPSNGGRFRLNAVFDDVANPAGGTEVVIGESPAYTKEQFADFWRRLATRFTSPRIFYALQNEPHEQDDARLLETHNAAIASIRAVGRANLILVNGNEWGTYGWLSGSANRIYMRRVVDPLNNRAVDIHHYLDPYGAGQTTEVVPRYMDPLTEFTTFARSAGIRAFLGEIGFSTDAASLAGGNSVLAHVEANQDVWLGWTYWTTVMYQSAYRYQLLPVQMTNWQMAPPPYTDRPQMAVLTQYLRRPLPPQLNSVAEALDPDFDAIPDHTFDFVSIAAPLGWIIGRRQRLK